MGRMEGGGAGPGFFGRRRRVIFFPGSAQCHRGNTHMCGVCICSTYDVGTNSVHRNEMGLVWVELCSVPCKQHTSKMLWSGQSHVFHQRKEPCFPRKKKQKRPPTQKTTTTNKLPKLPLTRGKTLALAAVEGCLPRVAERTLQRRGSNPVSPTAYPGAAAPGHEGVVLILATLAALTAITEQQWVSPAQYVALYALASRSTRTTATARTLLVQGTEE